MLNLRIKPTLYGHILSEKGEDLRRWGDDQPVQIGAGFEEFKGWACAFSEEIPRGNSEQYHGRLFAGHYLPGIDSTDPSYGDRNERIFEFFSFNSRQNPYFGGRRVPEDYRQPFTKPHFSDGSMGKSDPTLMPQLHDPRFPSLPFIRLLDYARKDLKNRPEYENLYEVWHSDDTTFLYDGYAQNNYIKAMVSRREYLEKRHQFNIARSGPFLARWPKLLDSWVGLLPSVEEIESFGTPMAFGNYVPQMAAIQRRFKIAESWNTMSDVLIEKQLDASQGLSISRSDTQDARFMGIWGNEMNPSMLKWYLYVAQIPVFWVHYRMDPDEPELPPNVPKFVNLIEGTAMSSYLVEARSFKLRDAAGRPTYYQTVFVDEAAVSLKASQIAVRNTRSFSTEESSIVISSGPVAATDTVAAADTVAATDRQKAGVLELSDYMSVLKLGLKKMSIIEEAIDLDEDEEIEIIETVRKFLTGSITACY